MTKVKVQTKERVGDAAWLEGLLKQAGAPVRSGEALVPLSGSVTMTEQALASPQLRTRAERIIQLAQEQHMPVFPVAVAPLFSGWRLHTRSAHRDYVFCNLAEDPLFRHPDRFPILRRFHPDSLVSRLLRSSIFHDRFPVPKQVLAHLESLKEAGFGNEFDVLYVVHEVKKGTVREGEPLDPNKLVPASPQVQRSSRRLGQFGTALWLGAATPLLAGVVGAGIAAAAAPAALLMLAPLGLDPLLLGAVVAPNRSVREGEMAVWFYLAHWQYEDEESRGQR